MVYFSMWPLMPKPHQDFLKLCCYYTFKWNILQKFNKCEENIKIIWCKLWHYERICRKTATFNLSRHCSVFKLITNEDGYLLPFDSLRHYKAKLEKTSHHLIFSGVLENSPISPLQLSEEFHNLHEKWFYQSQTHRNMPQGVQKIFIQLFCMKLSSY